MTTSLVATIIGPDRPGLVESVSRVVAAQGGNWLESRMAQMAGQFAGILRVEIAQDSAAALRQALEALGAQGLTVVVVPESNPHTVEAPRPVSLELVGADRAGIVNQISRAMAAHGVNVIELWTQRSSAPMSGEALFTARAKLQVPHDVSLAGLRDELEQIGSDLMVDVSLDESDATGQGSSGA